MKCERTGGAPAFEPGVRAETTAQAVRFVAPFILFLLGIVGPLTPDAGAQVVRDDFYVTNGTVRAAELRGNILYIGGDFTLVGPSTGSGVPIDTLSQLPVSAFPKVVGIVYAVAADGAGGWYIGGDFTSVGGVPRRNLAHILANGDVGPWNPGANDTVEALALSGGLIYVGGLFDDVGGEPRDFLASLDATTGSETGWYPTVDGDVSVITVSGGVIYIGGHFGYVEGTVRAGLAAFDEATGVRTAWDPKAERTAFPPDIRAIVVSGSTVYVGGQFDKMGGQYRTNLAAVDAVSGFATSWNPSPDTGDSGVEALAVAAGTVYVGGQFSVIGGGQSRHNLAALSATTGLATAWNPNVDGNVEAIAVSGGKVYVGGSILSIGGTPRPFLGAVSRATGLVDSWQPAPDNNVHVLAAAPGAVYVGGEFTTLSSTTRNHLAALNAATGVLTPWNPNPNGPVTALAASVNVVYVGGDFTSIGGQTRNRIAALDPTSGSASNWNPSANGSVLSLALSGSTVYAGGAFTNIGGQARSRIAALSASTGNATSWNPNANGIVYSIGLRATTVYAGGAFTAIGGQPRFRLAALSGSTGNATAWSPIANAAVFAVAPTTATVYVGGDFTALTAASRNYIAAVDTVGNVTAWDPNADGRVVAIAPADGVVYAGGGFQNIGGQARSDIAALDPGTGLATSWSVNADDSVEALVASGPNLFAGGAFTTMGGATQSFLASISAYCPAPTTFGIVSATSTNPQVSAIGDFNGDGQMDMAVAVAGGAQVMRNLGGGSFAPLTSLSPGGAGRSVVTADLNDDGALDLVVSTTTGLYVMLGQSNAGKPTGAFGSAIPCPLNGAVPAGVAVADLDNDGINDLVVALPAANVIAVLRGQGTNGIGDGTFTAPVTYAVGTAPSQLVLGDMDGDLVLDAVVTNSGDGTISVRFGNRYGGGGDATFPTVESLPVGANPNPIVSGDFNQDGATDLAVGCTGSVGVFLGNGYGTFTGVNYALENAHASVLDLKVADFDANGRADLAAALSDGTMQYLFGSGYSTLGDGRFQAGPVVTIGGALSSVEVNAFDLTAPAATPIVTQSDVGRIVSVEGSCSGGVGLTLEMTTPNGGETMELGASVPIEWRRGALVMAVNVEVSRDDGARWERIASNLTGNEYVWRVRPPGAKFGRIRVVDANLFTLSDASNGSFTMQPLVGVEDRGLPREPSLSAGYPNPTPGAVRFDLRLPKAGEATVEVFDVAGRRVAVLAQGWRQAGEHSLAWDGKTMGARAGDGVFFVRARVGGMQFVRRIVRIE